MYFGGTRISSPTAPRICRPKRDRLSRIVFVVWEKLAYSRSARSRYSRREIIFINRAWKSLIRFICRNCLSCASFKRMPPLLPLSSRTVIFSRTDASSAVRFFNWISVILLVSDNSNAAALNFSFSSVRRTFSRFPCSISRSRLSLSASLRRLTASASWYAVSAAKSSLSAMRRFSSSALSNVCFSRRRDSASASSASISRISSFNSFSASVWSSSSSFKRTDSSSAWRSASSLTR